MVGFVYRCPVLLVFATTVVFAIFFWNTACLNRVFTELRNGGVIRGRLIHTAID
jgi:hypothetical protein